MHLKFSLVIGTLAIATLAGCADTSASNNKGQNTAASAAGSSNQAGTASAATAAPAPAPMPQNSMAKLAAAADGTVAEFDKQSVELSTEARANIADMTKSALQAKHVLVTGYCDKQDNQKNARQVALARAIAVRNELIKQGVPAKTIRTKYVTTEARHAVTVVLK